MQDDFRATAPKPGAAPKIELGDFQDFTLDNGLRVILVENHKLPRVSYQLFVDKPPHLDGDMAGVSQLMGDMLRRGTSTKTKEEIDEAVDFIGANLSTGGSGAFASTITKYREDVLQLMAEVVLDAKFTQEEFDKVKDDALAGLKSSLANPDAIAGRVRRAVVYGKDHPYGELTTEETMNNITLDNVRNYYRRYFVPNRSYLVMVGDLTRAEAEMAAKKHFSGWQRKEVKEPKFEVPEAPRGTQVIFVPRAGSVQSVVTVAKPVDLQPGTKEAIRASIVNSILGSGFNGRLFQNLREDKAYTYGAYSGVSDDKLIGSFSANSSVRNEVTDSAVYEITYEMNKIATEKVTDDELRRAKAQVAGSFGRALESPQRIASYALNTIREDLDRDFYPTYLQKVQNSSANDLLEVSRRVMRPEDAYIIVVGDKSVAEKLKRFDVDGEIDYYDENGNKMDAAAIAALTPAGPTAASSDLTPQRVLSGYLDAIGGQAAIDKVKSITMTSEGSIQGTPIRQTTTRQDGDKMHIVVSVPSMGRTVQEVVYNGGKAKIEAQGNAMPVDEATLAKLGSQASLFPLLDLMNKPDEVTVAGMQDVNGKPAVVLEQNDDAGKTTYFFDAESMLLVRQITEFAGAKSTSDYSMYKPVNGVLLSHKEVSVSPAMPGEVIMTATKMEVNGTVDPMLFKVD